MFHVSFVIISNIYIFYTDFFSYNQMIFHTNDNILYIFRFISEKRAFCNYLIFFAYFLHKSYFRLESQTYVYFFSDSFSRLSKRNAGF